MYEDEDLQEIHEDIQELDADISILRKDLNNISASVEGSGENVTLNQTAEARFKKPPLPMGNSEQIPILPEGYTQLDYIEKSTNNLDAYIDAGFKPSNNTKVSINATVSSLEGAGRFLFGTRNSARTDTFAGLIWTDNKASGGFGNSGIYQSESVQNIDTKFNLTLDKNLLYHNGVLIKTFDEQQFTSENNLWIATLNNNGSTSQALTGKIYSCKIWDNGILIRDYIPCKRNSDNKIGMYDIVNDTFNSSANNYNFTAGSKATTPNPDYPQEITNVTGDVEVKVQNKNLWNTNFKKGGYDMQGNFFPTDKVWITNSLPITINSNTQYTITQKETPTSYRISFFNNETYLSYFTAVQELTHGYKSCTFTTPANCNKIYVSFRSTKEIISSGTYDMDVTDVTNVQLEVNSIATDYVEHQEQTFIFPLAEGQKLMLGDYLADDGIHRVRGQYIMTGQEIDWFEYTQSGEYSDNLKCYFGLYIELSNSLRKMKSSICSHFYNPNKWVIVPSLAKFGAYQDNPNTNNRYFITNIPTVGDWKNWLAQQYQNGTPVILEYELAEEIIVPYTLAQQEVYDIMKKAISYEEQTNVSGFSTKVSPKFNVKAFRNMNTSIESLQSRIELLKGRS